MDPIEAIRQMMAESKFHEAQRLCEVQFSLHENSLRPEILPLYLDSLEAQNKHLPTDLLLEAAESSTDIDEKQKWLERISPSEAKKYFRRIELLRIEITKKKGKLDELYKLVRSFKTQLFESKIPLQLNSLDEIEGEYFKTDFQLKLYDLAISGMLNDIPRSEKIVSSLISLCFERSTSRGNKERLLAIREIIRGLGEKRQLEIYMNLCSFLAEGLSKKEDYKKIAEMVIYFEDFKFQVLTLDLLHKLEQEDLARDYAIAMRSHPKYDFPYLDKFFRHLKPYFVTVAKPQTSRGPEKYDIDLTLEDEVIDHLEEVERIDFEPVEEESHIMSALKYSSYGFSELIELSVSFLQSDFYRAALTSTELAMSIASDDTEYLKSSFLKLTCLYNLGDYRAALDLSLESLKRAQTQDDVLAFLYLQSEIHLRLGDRDQARILLSKIYSIDEKYRLTKERLQRLNEIQ